MAAVSDQYDIWQFEQTGPHTGIWNRLPVEMDRPIHVNSANKFALPHFVSADSNGNVRIYSDEFYIYGKVNNLRYEREAYRRKP